MKASEFKQLFEKGTSINGITGLCGRIIRGKNPEDFETLTDDPNRKVVMLIGEDGLENILGKTGYEMLVAIGYEKDYIQRKVNEGNKFKLVVFEEGSQAMLATWENLVKIIDMIYPAVTQKVANAIPQLKNTPFEQIEKSADYGFSQVDKNGPSDENFMTYDRFVKSQGSLEDVRAFLYFTIHLRELFSGDGYTYTFDGKKELKEYFIPNLPIKDIPNHEIMDIQVSIPKQGVKQMKTYPIPPIF